MFESKSTDGFCFFFANQKCGSKFNPSLEKTNFQEKDGSQTVDES